MADSDVDIDLDYVTVQSIVMKSSCERLKGELKKSQSRFKEEEIDDMSRRQLVGYVTQLRIKAKSVQAVSTMINDFAPVIISTTSISEGDVTGAPINTSKPATGATNTTAELSTAQSLQMFMQSSKYNVNVERQQQQLQDMLKSLFEQQKIAQTEQNRLKQAELDAKIVENNSFTKRLHSSFE